MNQSYFVPRTLLQLPYSTAEYEQWLLPDLAIWRDQSREPLEGDDGMCCDTFLNEILPYLIECLVQDGIYFVVDHPTHPMAQYLCEKIPGYYQWAQAARNTVEVISMSGPTEEIKKLNKGTQAIVESLHRRIDSLEQSLLVQTQSVKSITTLLYEVLTSVRSKPNPQYLVPDKETRRPCPSGQGLCR